MKRKMMERDELHPYRKRHKQVQKPFSTGLRCVSVDCHSDSAVHKEQTFDQYPDCKLSEQKLKIMSTGLRNDPVGQHPNSADQEKQCHLKHELIYNERNLPIEKRDTAQVYTKAPECGSKLIWNSDNSGSR